MIARLDPIKRGTTFDHTILIPESYADGYFLGATVASQVRNARGILVATLECAWLDPLTTREIHVFGETGRWPLGRLFTDVRIYRASDRLQVFTDTVRFRLKPGQTDAVAPSE